MITSLILAAAFHILPPKNLCSKPKIPTLEDYPQQVYKCTPNPNYKPCKDYETFWFKNVRKYYILTCGSYISSNHV